MKTYKNIGLQKSESQQKGKARYVFDGCEYYVEEAAIKHYEKLGYNAVWTENDYWWMLMSLFFWDAIFAKVKGAVSAPVGTQYVEIGTDDERFESVFNNMIQMNGMPQDFFTPLFYKHRKELINNIIIDLLNSDLKAWLCDVHAKYYGKICRPIELWDKFSLEELLVAVNLLDKEKLIGILKRLISNFNENRAGLPDLIVYNENEFIFAEVKSKSDKISQKQRVWHSFLSDELGLNVEIFLVNHTERQIKRIMVTNSPAEK